MDKINLKEILNRVYDKEYRSSYKTGYSEQCILEAMKEACQETLKLAAKNAFAEESIIGYTWEVNEQSILDTINQIE